MRREILLIALSAISVVLSGIFLIKPAITGYSIYGQMSKYNYSVDEYAQGIENLKSEIENANVNLSSCYGFNERILTTLEEVDEKRAECIRQLELLNSSCSQREEICKADLQNLREQLNEKIDEYDELKESYDLLVVNVANNICCKKRIDNPAIKYYDVLNNMIVCLETGEKEISCP